MILSSFNGTNMKEVAIGSSLVRILTGDITKQTTDAVVNAANTRLAPGGGVAGAIHRAIGPLLSEECRSLGGCDTGEAKITHGFELNTRYIIHTVGPVYSGSKTDESQLASCYKNSLDLALTHDLQSISFPAISTGAFGYPLKDAARISLQTVKQWLQDHDVAFLVQFVLFDEDTYLLFDKFLNSI